MSVQTPIRDECETLDAIVARLGDIPLSRIWTCPPPGTATESDVLHADEQLDRLCELVDGVLVEKPMGYMESKLAALIIMELGSHLNIHDLGDVAGADGMLKL